MKKTFQLFIVILVFALFFVSNAAAVDKTKTAALKVEYELPYPGILVDHPLYFMKNWRDNIMLSLITDPAKKVDFYVLRSDKFLAMANSYFDNNKWELFLKALDYSHENMNQAVTGLVNIKSNTNNLSEDTLEKVKKSYAKHIEIINNYIFNTSGDRKESLVKELDQWNKFELNLKKVIE